MGVLKDLVQQTADSVNKMSVAVETLQQQMRTQQEAVERQARSGLRPGAVAERLARRGQGAAERDGEGLAGRPEPAAVHQRRAAEHRARRGRPRQLVPSTSDTPRLPPRRRRPHAGDNKPSAAFPSPRIRARSRSAGAHRRRAVRRTSTTARSGDYMAAKYPLATSRVQPGHPAPIPADPLAGNAYYYLGEIDYRAGKYAAAVKDYDHVLEQYPSNPKVPVSHLHKGMALLAMKDRDGGVAEFRALIQRFPNSPEATQARSKLNGMGVRPAAPRNP